jgi:hypothetical protein
VFLSEQLVHPATGEQHRRDFPSLPAAFAAAGIEVVEVVAEPVALAVDTGDSEEWGQEEFSAVAVLASVPTNLNQTLFSLRPTLSDSGFGCQGYSTKYRNAITSYALHSKN